jgi:polysaccharide export outer membrane protein
LKVGWAVAVVLVLALTLVPVEGARAQTQGGTAGEAADREPEYRIAAGDQIEITVFGEPELSGARTVRPDGRLDAPLLGAVRAFARTPAELARVLEARYGTYLADPRVTVRLLNAAGTSERAVYAIGRGLPQPRRFSYRAGMRAVDVLNALGSLPATAAPGDAYVLRTRPDGTRERIDVDLEQVEGTGTGSGRMALRPGDVVVIPEGFFSGDWTVSSSVSNSYTYTDNIGLEPDDQAESALIAELTPSVTVSGEAGRIRGAATGALSLQRVEFNRTDSQVLPRLSASGTVELARDLFFTDAAASVQQQADSRGNAVSGTEANQTNRQTVQTYRLSPYLDTRLGRFARMETRYTANATLIEADEQGADGSESLENRGSVRLDSGPRFQNFDWTLLALASDIQVVDGTDTRRQEVRFESTYPLTRTFALIGEVGYQRLEVEEDAGAAIASAAEQEVDGPLYRAGFLWTPSPDAQLRVTYGEEDDSPSLALEANYDVSARTSLSASFREDVETTQERLAGRLPTGQEEVGTERIDDVELRAGVTRTRTARVSAETAVGRTELGLSGVYQEEEAGASGGAKLQEGYDLVLDLQRPLRRDLVLGARGSYATTDFSAQSPDGAGREDDTYVGNLSLSYTGFRRVELGTGYTFTHRESTAPEAGYTENAVTLFGTIRF